MKSAFKISIVFCLAFLAGVNFVIFPALSPALMQPDIFGLSSVQFGNLFVPQVIFIAISCLLAPFLSNKFGGKNVLIFGVSLMLLATFLLWNSQFFLADKSNLPISIFSFLMILVSVLGFGFGTSITVLNPLAASFFNDNKASAILILQFLVGLGTSTSPLILFFLNDIHRWMLVPALIMIAVFIVLLFFIFIKVEEGQFFQLPKKIEIPSQLWLFILAIIMYGFLEGTFGSFGTLILKDKGLATHWASLGLSLFWGGIAVNRLLFGIFSRIKDLSKLFVLSPLLVGIVLIGFQYSTSAVLILSSIFLIGFFMGSIFPGVIGWCTVEFPQLSVLVSGFLMAANQIGTGIVTNVLGAFQQEFPMKYVIVALCIIVVLIFILFRKLSVNSKIKEAF